MEYCPVGGGAGCGPNPAHLEESSDVVLANVVYGPDRAVIKGDILKMSCAREAHSNCQYSRGRLLRS